MRLQVKRLTIGTKSNEKGTSRSLTEASTFTKPTKRFSRTLLVTLSLSALLLIAEWLVIQQGRTLQRTREVAFWTGIGLLAFALTLIYLPEMARKRWPEFSKRAQVITDNRIALV